MDHLSKMTIKTTRNERDHNVLNPSSNPLHIPLFKFWVPL